MKKLVKMVPLLAAGQPIRVFAWCVALPVSFVILPLHVDSGTNSAEEKSKYIYIRQAKKERKMQFAKRKWDWVVCYSPQHAV